MALQTSGAISLANVQTEFGGVNPISISEYYGKAAGIPVSGTISLSHFYGKSNGVLTLKEVVFNASGTFTMPSGVVDNQIIVGCTGGGGGCVNYLDDGYTQGAGGGSGRTSGTFSLAQGQIVTVTVGAGGNMPYSGTASAGGTSSFSTLSCAGGKGGTGTGINGTGVNGGGNGAIGKGGDANCAAILTLKSGAVDKTGGLYLAKKTIGGSTPGYRCGGAGCYGSGGANTGAGGGDQPVDGTPGSGKVVIYYYIYE